MSVFTKRTFPTHVKSAVRLTSLGAGMGSPEPCRHELDSTVLQEGTRPESPTPLICASALWVPSTAAEKGHPLADLEAPAGGTETLRAPAWESATQALAPCRG